MYNNVLVAELRDKSKTIEMTAIENNLPHDFVEGILEGIADLKKGNISSYEFGKKQNIGANE